MSVFTSRRVLRRRQFWVVSKFFLAMAVLTVVFLVAVAGHYALAWW